MKLHPLVADSRPVEPRFVRDTAECAAGVARDAGADFVRRNTADRFSPETAFIWVNAHSH